MRRAGWWYRAAALFTLLCPPSVISLRPSFRPRHLLSSTTTASIRRRGLHECAAETRHVLRAAAEGGGEEAEAQGPSPAQVVSEAAYALAAGTMKRTEFERIAQEQLKRSSSSSSGPRRELIVGLNKYSHDTAICVVEAATGAILFAAEKERLTRRKHDGGPVDDLVAHALDCIDDASLEAAT